MKNYAVLFLFSALFLISGYHATDVPQTPPPITSTSSKAPDVTPVPPTTSSTQATTTSSSTTTKTTTSTSTEIPTTTPTPTTHAPPTPTPEPEVQKWNVTVKDGTIIVKMAGQIVIIKDKLSHALNVPKTANATGTSSPNYQSIMLSWKSNGSGNDYVQLNFNKYNASKTYDLASVQVSIEPEDLPGMGELVTLKLSHKDEHFNVTLDNSYRCTKLQNFNLTRDDGTIAGHLKVSNLQFQAFKTDNNAVFGVAEDCAFETTDVVPIAVGCILAGLVVIILVGYLITRRRSQARGYLSM